VLDPRVLGTQAVVEHVSELERGAEARQFYERGATGICMPCIYSLSHIIASITREKYDKINPGIFVAPDTKQ
jgi:hypothetical protein